MAIKKVNIKNFTVFDDISIDFSSGVNVIIGENGTGKTHLMKAMYWASKQEEIPITKYFKVPNAKELISNSNDEFDIKIDVESEINTAYIPAKEMLTHSKGLISMYGKYGFNMPFDKSMIDVVSNALCWNLAEIPEIGKNILPRIEEIIGGTVEVIDEVFYIKKFDGRLVNFSVEAEGIKKLALIWQLIMNETITNNSILFWDEADSNVNPKLFSDIAKTLLELSRYGVQVFITSHSYVLAKYIEVLKKDTDNVMFYSFSKDEDKSTNCETHNNFRDLKNNAIMSTLDDLVEIVYDLDLAEKYG